MGKWVFLFVSVCYQVSYCFKRQYFAYRTRIATCLMYLWSHILVGMKLNLT